MRIDGLDQTAVEMFTDRIHQQPINCSVIHSQKRVTISYLITKLNIGYYLTYVHSEKHMRRVQQYIYTSLHVYIYTVYYTLCI